MKIFSSNKVIQELKHLLEVQFKEMFDSKLKMRALVKAFRPLLPVKEAEVVRGTKRKAVEID